jgi:hypothetical protein
LSELPRETGLADGALGKPGGVCACADRQFVFTIPKRLRIYFRFDRRLLGELCRAAWQVVRQIYQAASAHAESVPG